MAAKRKKAKKKPAKKKPAKKKPAKKKPAKKSGATKKKSGATKKKSGATKKKSGATKKKSGATKKKANKKPTGKQSTWWLPVGLVGIVVAGGVLYSQRGDAETPEREEVVDVTEPDPPTKLGPTTVPEALRVRVVQRHDHDTQAFTQGLLWHDGVFYESTGLEGRSSVRRVSIDGTVQAQVDLDDELFAEGLARVGDELFQITWQNEVAFVYDLTTLERKREYSYEGEGWGLCYDGTHLVMSDGSATLVFRDPESFEIQRRVEVTRIGRPVRFLNELECVDGAVYANVWQREQIVRIDPQSGAVTATINAHGLLDRTERRAADVLNGIAWIPDRNRFVLTGKLWPALFEVEFVPRDE